MRISIMLLAIVLGLWSCKSKNETVNEDVFPRREMLQNFADNLISPSLALFQERTSKLHEVTLKFSSAPSQESLDSLQMELDRTFIAWQYCSWFRYGAASTYFGATDGIPRKDEINTYPITVVGIENNINSGNYTFANSNVDARGLNAVDYLVNPLQGMHDSTVLNKFSSAPNRREYLKAVVSNLKTNANNALNAWATEKGSFVSADGKDAASSSSLTALYWDVDYEAVKNYKVGIPVGRIQAGQTLSPFPTKVEAYYNGQSLVYIKHNLLALENLWYGRSRSGVDGIGYDDYLNASNASDVTNAIAHQFGAIHCKLAALPDERLSEVIKTNKQPVQDLYTELLKLTHLVKSDMVSRLSLSITYASGDGD